MLCLIVSLIVLLVLAAIVYVIVGKIPVPPDWGWLVQVILLVVFVILLLEVITGSLSFCGLFHFYGGALNFGGRGCS